MARNTEAGGKPSRSLDLSSFPEENPSPVLRVAGGGRVLYANSAARRVFKLGRAAGAKLPKHVREAIGRARNGKSTSTVRVAAGPRIYALFVVPVPSQGYVNLYGRDVTQEVAAEREIKDLAKFPDENPNPVLRAMPSGKVLFANRAARGIRGLVVKGETLAAALSPALSRARKNGSIQEADFESGRRIFAFSLMPVRGEDYVNIYGRDVSEERRSQREVESLARFPDENPNPVLRVSGTGRVLYANTAAVGLKGLLVDGGKKLVPAITRPLARAFREERAGTAEFQAAGRLFTFALTPVPGEAYVNVYGRDITEERRAHLEIVRIKNFNQDVLNALTNGILTLNGARKVTSANPAARRVFGVEDEDEDIEGRPLRELAAGANAWLLEAVEEAARNSGPQVLMDRELVGRDGRRTSVNLTIAPFRNSRAEDSGLILVFEDITREKRIKGTMVRFMSDTVVERLLEVDEAALAGTAQEASILFSDIREFTSLSRLLGAQEMVRILNAYFSDMVDILFESGGTLDKFIGDAIMAVFGAPFQTPRDTDNAVIAAVEMLRRLRPFNESRIAEGYLPLDIGVGIDTGPVIAGTIGSPRRMDYTVIGEHVNLAARIESVNKLYGTHVLISEATRAKLDEGRRIREVDLVRVAGVDAPVRLFEVLDYHTEETFPNMDKALEAFAEGLACYRDRKWKEGAAAFGRALNLNPNDRPTQIFLSRCWGFLARPPDRNWSGVTNLAG